MRESDRDYYRRRIVEETSRAENCDNAEIKSLHLELLELYSGRLAALEEGFPRMATG